MPIILFCFLGCFSATAQKDTVLVKPLLAFKFAPLGVLAPDPNFQFQAEYFITETKSIEVGFGIGSNRTFKESSNAATRIYRIEHKWYFRPFTTERRSVGYFATELMHKDMLIDKIAYKTSDDFLDTEDKVDFQLDANFTAIRLKYGYTFFGEKGIPVFNAFIGAGAGLSNHRNLTLPTGYIEDNFRTNFFRRTEGSRIALSAHAGISFGFGIARKN